MVEILSTILGILGLLATLAGLWFSYITFVTPMKRYKRYLKDTDSWAFTSSRFNESYEFWQYTIHPEFTIELKNDGEWNREEPWVRRIHRPDPSLFMYEVALKMGGNIIHTERFLAMDGWRYFVPIPRVEYDDSGLEENNFYYYDKLQILIFGIIGKLHMDKDIHSFMKHAGISLR